MVETGVLNKLVSNVSTYTGTVGGNMADKHTDVLKDI